MGEDQEEETNVPPGELTAFQYTVLLVLADESRYGLAIKDELEEYYGTEINHGRLYPNLDEIAEDGLIEKRSLDTHTNQYELTEDGYETIRARLDWELSKVITDGERAETVVRLIENVDRNE
ncbi:PadR family transcriptional regulator [Halalkalicoccus salilacus]|uniref:PadR family transcriptional regulator n=1 Tax=Halalkalicoccus salilacus TaxID=3117459 RepID=UPI00300E8BAC